MQAKGWSRLERSQHPGWHRRTEDRHEMLLYINFKGEDSLAFSWGFDLAKKKLPRSFAAQIAADHGGLFSQALLAGFDSFSRPRTETRGDE
jgi:hypothetical protein